MSTERRFLVAPSFARLIQRERGTTGRIVEAYFQPRPDRRQLVRVEQHRSRLVLLTQAEDGRFAEEQTEIPLHHAEALIDAASGTIAFDRTSLSLGGDIEAILNRFIIPRGLDLLAVTIPSVPDAFAPLPWFGLEVTDEPAYGAMGLALDGAPNVDPMEPSNVALEALLDTLEGRSFHDLRPSVRTSEGERSRTTAPPPSIPVAVGLEAFVPATAASGNAFRGHGTAATNAAEDQEESYGNSSVRKLARSLGPRNRDPQ